MARTSDVNSATSQFFVNLSDNGFLDHGPRDYGYAVFGRVTEGMDVDRQDRQGQDRPPQGLPGRAAGGCHHHLRASASKRSSLSGAARRRLPGRSAASCLGALFKLAAAQCFGFVLVTCVGGAPAALDPSAHQRLHARGALARMAAGERGYQTDYRVGRASSRSPRTRPSPSSPPRTSSFRFTPASISTPSASRCAPASTARSCAAPAPSRNRWPRICSSGTASFVRKASGSLLHRADRGSVAEGAHPRDVSEHRRVRPRRLWSRSRRPTLLPQAGGTPHLERGGPAGGRAAQPAPATGRPALALTSCPAATGFSARCAAWAAPATSGDRERERSATPAAGGRPVAKAARRQPRKHGAPPSCRNPDSAPATSPPRRR